MRNIHTQSLLEKALQRVHLSEVAPNTNEKYFLEHFINSELMETDDGISLIELVDANHTHHYEIMRVSLDGLGHLFNSSYEALKFAIDKYRIVISELKDTKFKIDKHTLQLSQDSVGNPTEPYSLNGVALFYNDIRVDGLYLLAESLATHLGYFRDDGEQDDLTVDDIM